MLLRALGWIAGGLVASTAMAQPQPEQVTNPVGQSEQAIAEGRELYNRTCTVCHGMNGTAGDRAPGLGGGRSYVIRTDGGIFEAIQKGIPGSAMPASPLQPMD